MADPLAEAMSMLDAVTNGESFEDFAIDSDDEDNLQDMNLGGNVLEDGASSKEKEIGTDGFVGAGASNVDSNESGGNASCEHPLQMMGVQGSDPLLQVDPLTTVNATSGPISQQEPGMNALSEGGGVNMQHPGGETVSLRNEHS